MSLFGSKIDNWYDRLRSSYWLIPGLFAVTAMVMATATLVLDRLIQQYNLADILEPAWIFTTSPSGARALLSTVASSMITVTGIVFSITLVTLSLASQQFGPRLLQNFLRDRGNQVVLAIITATYLYCLLILRTVGGDSGQDFVPNLSVFISLVLAIFCVIALIYFLHHVVHSIQITHIIERIHNDLIDLLDLQLDNADDDSPLPSEMLWPDDQGKDVLMEKYPFGEPIVQQRVGYLQSIDHEGLVALAEKYDAVIRVEKRVGHFINYDSVLITMFRDFELTVTEDLQRDVAAHFIVGRKRTQNQDIEFLIAELVEIALRALSPGVNDPFTAMNCIDHLGSVFCYLPRKSFPDPQLRDDQGRIRVICYPQSYGRLVDASFNQIRQFAAGNIAVQVRLLETLRRAFYRAEQSDQFAPLLLQVEQTWAGIQREKMVEYDFACVEKIYNEIMRVANDKGVKPVL